MKVFLAVSLLLLPAAVRSQNTDVARLQSTCLPTLITLMVPSLPEWFHPF